MRVGSGGSQLSLILDSKLLMPVIRLFFARSARVKLLVVLCGVCEPYPYSSPAALRLSEQPRAGDLGPMDVGWVF